MTVKECHKERPFLDSLAYNRNAYVSKGSGLNQLSYEEV